MLISCVHQLKNRIAHRLSRTALYGMWILLPALIVQSNATLAQSNKQQIGAIYSFSNPASDKINLRFTKQMQDALESGVPLNIELDFVYITPRIFLDNHSLFERHEYEVKRHALSNRYMVLYNNESRPELFATLTGLTDYLGGESIRLFFEYTKLNQELVTSESSVAHLRMSLDKYKLPGPVRLSAFISNQWEFDTGWIKWDFEN